eukprot:849065-Amphidinium_carterae.2
MGPSFIRLSPSIKVASFFGAPRSWSAATGQWWNEQHPYGFLAGCCEEHFEIEETLPEANHQD